MLALAGWLLGCEVSMYPETRSAMLVASDAYVPWYEQATRAFGVASVALNAQQVSARGAVADRAARQRKG